MSKSLKRVEAALTAASITPDLRAPGETRTAEMAAAAVGCAVDQIAKSIIFQGQTSGHVVLFITAGSNRVCATKASRLAQEALGKADAALIRSETGFAIGGVAPIGHTGPVRSFLDPRLLDFDTIWAAAGTPRHVFSISPPDLHRITGAIIGDFIE